MTSLASANRRLWQICVEQVCSITRDAKTILCICDDHGMLGYQRALLERRGYNVLTANSARQGLQIAAACVIASVIVDHHIAEMNGHEIATEIKRLTPQVPIVMLSSDEEIPAVVDRI